MFPATRTAFTARYGNLSLPAQTCPISRFRFFKRNRLKSNRPGNLELAPMAGIGPVTAEKAPALGRAGSDWDGPAVWRSGSSPKLRYSTVAQPRGRARPAHGRHREAGRP